MRMTFKDEFEFTWTGDLPLPPENKLRRDLVYLSIHQRYGRTLEHIENVVDLGMRRVAERRQQEWEAYLAEKEADPERRGKPNVISLEGCDVAGSRGNYSRY